MINYEPIIKMFLQYNPKPADAQYHALAQALGTDHETLESVAYEMLHYELCDDGEIECQPPMEEVNANPPSVYEGTTYTGIGDNAHPNLTNASISEDFEILDGNYNPATTGPKLILNDGEMSPARDQNLQNLTNNDGSVEDIDDLDDLLYSDGTPQPTITMRT